MLMNASKNIQYPAPTGPYKVFVKDKGLWQKHDTARLQISLSNPKHTGKKFSALAEWAAARFDHVTLVVSDTLHRHNLALNLNLDHRAAYESALSQGDYWISQNQEALNVIPNRTVTRWDDWLSHPDFNEAHALMIKLYGEHDGVRVAVQEKAASFSGKRIEDLMDAFSPRAITDTSVRYIIEELAAFSLMFRGKRTIDIYPGDWFQDAFNVLKTVENMPLLSGFEKAECLRVDFVRNNAPRYASYQKAA